MLFRFIAVCITILISYSNIYSQTPPYYNYTSSDGLGSSTVFHMIQDKEGYLWFGTLNGLSRFDGTRFITYRTKDGLNSNSNTFIIEYENNKFLISNFERGINLLSNGKFENLIENFEGRYQTISYMVYYEQKIYAYTPLLNINVICNSEKGKDSVYTVRTRQIMVNKLVVLPDGKLAAITHTGLYEFKKGTFTKNIIEGLNHINITSYAKDTDGSYLLGSVGKIFRIKNNKVTKVYNIDFSKEVKIENIFIDKNKNIWLGAPGKGFYVIYNGSDEIINVASKLKLEITHITNFLEDREGNIWISTFGKGVYCLNNLYLKNYSEYDGLINNNINYITKDNFGRIIIGTYKGINILENNELFKLKSELGEELIGDVNNIIIDKNNVYVAWSSNPLFSTSVKYKELYFSIIGRRSILKTSFGKYFYGGWGNDIGVSTKFDVKAKYPLYFMFSDSIQSNRIYSIKEDCKKNIWIGSALGLVKLTNIIENHGEWKWDKSFFYNNPILNSRINSIYEDSSSNVWFAGSKGVAKYNLTDGVINNYSEFQNYDLSSANALSSDNINRIWIGTLRGLYVLEGDDIKYLNTKTGLPSDEILSLFYDNEKSLMYIGTSNGLSILDIKMFDENVNPSLRVNILEVVAGDSLYNDFNNLEFEPEQNNIFIKFNALSFSSPGTVKYKYKLFNRWNETNLDFLNLVSLKHGKFTIEIAAKSQNTDWGEPVTLSFIIKPKFIETIWFYLLLFSILVCIHVLFIYWRIRTNKKKIIAELELNQRINELKHQALSAMMNPHFIFNSLNSVQYLINYKRNEEANNYIAMMAKLIRKNLETAGEGFILLTEEISRLKLYLDLEKLRFQDRFYYEIIVGSDLNIDSVMIPNMIIQPFVENSLWHGIINSAVNGILQIFFSFEDVEIESHISRVLIIRITDNGVGIKEATKNKKDDHISKGIEIIEERLRLLSMKLEIPKPIMIEDLSERTEKTQGTEIIISLPPPLYKSIS